MKTEGLEILLASPATPADYRTVQGPSFRGRADERARAIEAARSLNRMDVRNLTQTFAEKLTGLDLSYDESAEEIEKRGIPAWIPVMAVRIAGRNEQSAIAQDMYINLVAILETIPEGCDMDRVAQIMMAERICTHPFADTIKGPGSAEINEVRSEMAKALYSGNTESMKSAKAMAEAMMVTATNDRRKNFLRTIAATASYKEKQGQVINAVHGVAAAPNGGRRPWELNNLKRAVERSMSQG